MAHSMDTSVPVKVEFDESHEFADFIRLGVIAREAFSNVSRARTPRQRTKLEREARIAREACDEAYAVMCEAYPWF